MHEAVGGLCYAGIEATHTNPEDQSLLRVPRFCTQASEEWQMYV